MASKMQHDPLAQRADGQRAWPRIGVLDCQVRALRCARQTLFKLTPDAAPPFSPSVWRVYGTSARAILAHTYAEVPLHSGLRLWNTLSDYPQGEIDFCGHIPHLFIANRACQGTSSSCTYFAGAKVGIRKGASRGKHCSVGFDWLVSALLDGVSPCLLAT